MNFGLKRLIDVRYTHQQEYREESIEYKGKIMRKIIDFIFIFQRVDL